MRLLVTFLTVAVLLIEISNAVQLDEASANQLRSLEGLIGDAVSNIENLKVDLQEAVLYDEFHNPESVLSNVTRVIQKLQEITSTTESLLLHSQFERYRTIIAAIRIINSTCARMAIELERVRPIIGPGTLSDETQEKASDVSQHLNVGQVLLERYLAILMDTS
ncbi:uncharacterized protein LOC128743927 [Sabethes cyaneus]|uniref:uncharacterized protein LOC128743927 n=1 Tax=Sabethes cyaneus TaxID=53552 RepID=UPI00237ED910|nr:uncharacterized protein LOC128743927 [Sabethes cyaneus]